MPHVNFHDLRHSCASVLVGLGVDLYTISKVLGKAACGPPNDTPTFRWPPSARRYRK